MKILAIRGKNLASLEGHFEIDFRKEPLHSSGIFAITGNTGSGKSTLLDAMCIALFNNSPRINNVSDSSDIIDVHNLTIKEKDCRNILRRGTSDGFAEVDFLALDGKEYRSRWSVRRSRDKADGKLQDYTYTLHNITDAYEIPGLKTELLAKVRELLGLTFEQFTRAVLLAQGEFATFLKAPSRNKAEILEKLTGTEIYSKISASIYEKSKTADNELRIVREKIDEINILSDELCDALKKEHDTLLAENHIADETKRQLTQKIKWLERFTQLHNELEKAKEEASISCKAVKEAEPQEKELKQIESIQEIRDTYLEILTCKRNREENNRLIEIQKNEIIQISKSLSLAEEKVKNLLKQQSKISDEWNNIAPKIKEALRIETEYKNHTAIFKENQKELHTLITQEEEGKKEIKKLTEESNAGQIRLKQIAEWFTNNKEYEQIIPKTEIIAINIAEIKECSQQIETKSKLLASATDTLQKTDLQFKNEHKQMEQLNSMLTTEIATLRKRLVEGEPCPVCGNTHHIYTKVNEQTLHEEHLTKAKKLSEENIERLTNSIENLKNEITTLKVSIASYETHCNERMSKIIELLSPLPDAKEIIKKNDFVETLKTIACEWQQKDEETTAINKQLTIENNRLTTIKEHLHKIREQIREREQRCEINKKDLDEYQRQLKQLLGDNATVEAMETRIAQQIATINENVAKAIEQRNAHLVEHEKATVVLKRACQAEERQKVEFEELKQKIELFIEQHQAIGGLSELHRLATIPPNEIANLRNRINILKTNEIKAVATLKERERNIEEHNIAPERPQQHESRTAIEESIRTMEEEIKKRLERITEIGASLKNDKAAKELSQKLLKEYNEKGEKADNWKKLNEMFGSADGSKFKVMAQGYTLDILLGYANKHLKDISQRYELARVSPATLSIKVIDLDMLSETRSVHSLSGGESFLISLALALALSSLSSNRMSIGSLFIDEGFGSLDSETLRIAMEALERLQNHGRKIGVISHLGDMIERIPTRIHITKGASGKSTIEIRNNTN